MGRSPYQSEKRRKELARLKKQEEKRQRRFNKKNEGEKGPEDQEGTVPEGSNPAEPTSEQAAPAPQDNPQTQPPPGGEESGQTS
ncbi:MAG: hypothetical protein ACLQCB_21285 [Spirochaetia bacterium]